MYTPVTIRKGTPADLKALQELFVGTITTVCSAHYAPEQIEVWASSAKNSQRWNDMIANQYVLVAESDMQIAGFATLHHGVYIDFFYIHKDHQRQGIALQLYTAIEKEAIREGHTEIWSDISKTARPFFEKRGFRVIKEQTIVRKQVALTNIKMKKSLSRPLPEHTPSKQVP